MRSKVGSRFGANVLSRSLVILMSSFVRRKSIRSPGWAEVGEVEVVCHSWREERLEFIHSCAAISKIRYWSSFGNLVKYRKSAEVELGFDWKIPIASMVGLVSLKRLGWGWGRGLGYGTSRQEPMRWRAG